MPSVSLPNQTLVIPFDSTNSYLYQQVIYQAADPDDNMPQTSHLPPSVIHLIALWIQGGAPKN
jgi:hypothetical protein